MVHYFFTGINTNPPVKTNIQLKSEWQNEHQTPPPSCRTYQERDSWCLGPTHPYDHKTWNPPDHYEEVAGRAGATFLDSRNCEKAKGCFLVDITKERGLVMTRCRSVEDRWWLSTSPPITQRSGRR